ncbi:MAG TPA: terpene cyclase/mutase family protein [Thermoanaerobaculia bacterium]|nr:terpene cyclase/mutase family protein [Thermoanaerobaculia bacterium]
MTLSAGEPNASRVDRARLEPRSRRAARAVDDARGWLLAAQASDGHWCGELEGDTILETEYVLLLHFLGRLGDPRVVKAARYVRRQQGPHGGWAIYPGGPPEVSASVKAYFVLKLAGDAADAPHMQRARRTILELGGIEACNSFTKIYLAICGQYDWWRCPAVPPEMVLLPRWVYFNLYEMSAWSRGIVVPLSIVWAMRPVRPVAAEHRIDELHAATSAARPALLAPQAPQAPQGHQGHQGHQGTQGTQGTPRGKDQPGASIHPAPGPHRPGEPAAPPPRARRLPAVLGGASRFWRACFLMLDRSLKAGERLRLTPFRRLALARAEAWILARLEDSDGLGAIFPPIVNTIFALCCLGYDPDHPVVRGQIQELERLEIEDSPGESRDALRLQPCFSAVWDTALAMHALSDSGIEPEHAAIQEARRWLVEREIRRTGDWSVKAPGVAPSGWCFEYRNASYPDCDDTAEVLTALSALDGPSGGRDDPAVRRGVAWLLGMQNDDGGWGAFDRGCDKEILTHVPFADHNALLDPSTADVTGRVVDCLLRLGMAPDAPELARAAAFLRRQQEADGSWYGRWGCNYIYGTWLALTALARRGGSQAAPTATGASAHATTATGMTGTAGGIAGEPWCRRAADWLLSCQNPDGGWGESPRSYDDPTQKGIGTSTAAQTAWALLGLFAAGALDAPGAAGDIGATGTAGDLAVERGVDYLLASQLADGSWHDEPWTATGFPRVFYLRYHLYAVYFPLMALSAYRRVLATRQPRGEGQAATSTLHAYPLAVPARPAAVEGVVR